MAVFDWLLPARDFVNESPEFRKFGSVDFKLALKSGKHCKLVHFHGFAVGEIRDLDPDMPFAEADLMIDMPTRAWNSYLKKRSVRRGETLQSLDLDKQVISAGNPLNRRLFDRYQLSIQAFVDAGANWIPRRANV